MAVRDIAHVELYTQDMASTVDYFVSAMGFTRIAESMDGELNSVLLYQGGHLVVTSGPGTHGFLERHGDGIADIAFACDDVTATYYSALAAGALPVTSPSGKPAVSGFGDVCHSLVAVADEPAIGAAAGRQWVPVPHGSDGPQGPIRFLDHVAICLEGGTLGQYEDFYREGFGFSRFSSEHIVVGGQGMDSTVVRSASERVIFTLVAPDPTRDSGQLDAFLQRNGGPGVQHLAFLVDDIISAVHAFRERGVEFLTTPASYYDTLAERLTGLAHEIEALRGANVLADSDEWGHLLQLFTRPPLDGNTIFFELIQRQGSRGFGSKNIKALYEAVERDRLTSQSTSGAVAPH
jgi:4-hydroxymandelate synthase